MRHVLEEFDVETGELALGISEGVRLGVSQAGHADGAGLDQAVGVISWSRSGGAGAAAGGQGKHSGEGRSYNSAFAAAVSFEHVIFPIGV